MKKLTSLLSIAAIALSFNASAYVSCKDVTIEDINVTKSEYFNGFANVGFTGPIVYTVIDSSKCSVVNEEANLSDRVIFAIEGYQDSQSQIKQFWSSLLLTASSTGKTIDFHANIAGNDGANRSVLNTYYLKLK